MRMTAMLGGALALALTATAARAEVVEAQDWGFQVRHVYQVAAPPERVWAVLVQPSRWWDPEHSWFGRAEGLTLDLKPGGCFCEIGPDGAGARHMDVAYVKPRESLHLWGALGPLHTEGVTGGLVIELKPAAGGTELTVTYTAGGFAKGGLKQWAPLVDGVVGHQFEGLEKAAAGAKAQ